MPQFPRDDLCRRFNPYNLPLDFPELERLIRKVGQCDEIDFTLAANQFHIDRLRADS